MQIRTGLTLAAGVGIGIFVGMGVSNDTKDRIKNIVKRRLVIALTGEDWNPKGPVKYETKYTNDDWQPKKPMKSKEPIKYTNDDWEPYLHFKSSEAAWDFVYQMYKKCEQNPNHTISVLEVCQERGHDLDWHWDKYGWTLEEVKNDWKAVYTNDPLKQEFKMETPKPHEI